MASQIEEKVSKNTLDINDIQNKLSQINERLENRKELHQNDILVINNSITQIRADLQDIKKINGNQLEELTTKVDECIDSTTAIAKTVKGMIASKNRFNQNMWKIIIAVVAAILVYFIQQFLNGNSILQSRNQQVVINNDIHETLILLQKEQKELRNILENK